MGEFYELKRKDTARQDKHSIDYWKAQCKASEAKVKNLEQALVATESTIDTLQKTLGVMERVLGALGFKMQRGRRFIDELVSSGIGVLLIPGMKPKFYTTVDTEMRDNALSQLRRIDGVEVELDVADGLRIGPHFSKQ